MELEHSGAEEALNLRAPHPIRPGPAPTAHRPHTRNNRYAAAELGEIGMISPNFQYAFGETSCAQIATVRRITCMLLCASCLVTTSCRRSDPLLLCEHSKVIEKRQHLIDVIRGDYSDWSEADHQRFRGLMGNVYHLIPAKKVVELFGHADQRMEDLKSGDTIPNSV